MNYLKLASRAASAIAILFTVILWLGVLGPMVISGTNNLLILAYCFTSSFVVAFLGVIAYLYVKTKLDKIRLDKKDEL